MTRQAVLSLPLTRALRGTGLMLNLLGAGFGLNSQFQSCELLQFTVKAPEFHIQLCSPRNASKSPEPYFQPKKQPELLEYQPPAIG